ncbi:MAG: response regulator [candidate division Zixibacteria bacterium HGW-Zixibacteria-1]|nr:MAG: response regulator [candidate division Zixibacteria bacterium HGW-Zixibacteria-1]
MKENNSRTPDSKGNILIVDDEDVVIDVAELVLRRAGYHVVTARGGPEAVGLMQAHTRACDKFDAVILDLLLSGEPAGQELIETFLGIDPDSRIIISSGNPFDHMILHYSEYGISGILNKPYRAGDLIAAIEKVIADNVAAD